MDKKVILHMTLTPLTSQDTFKSYKVMPRSQVSKKTLENAQTVIIALREF